jgi:hypothetical protein
MRRFPLVILFCASLCSFEHLSAQTAIADTTYRRVALQQATDFYFRSVAESGFLNYGNEVIEYPDKSVSHPFYSEDRFVYGTINGFGVTYHDIPVKYDIVHDKLIVLDFNKIFKVEQVSERIDSFSLFGHGFVRLTADSMNQSGIATGFYDRLFMGNSVALFAKRKKIASELIKEGHSELNFKERNYYFIRKEDAYYEVSDKSSVMNALKDKKKELDVFLKKNKIKFNRNREYAMTLLAEHYESLKN